MPTPKIRSTAGALSGAAAALWLTPAYPHAVCGDRIFPATLAIDDPGVTDEMSLPSLTWLHPGSFGWDALDTEAKYQFFCIPEHEFMGSIGFDVTWGAASTGAQTGSPHP